MDDRTSWPQTEQLICTSYRHWLRIWETSTGKNKQPNSMVGQTSINGIEEQYDYLQLTDKGETINKGRTEENIASTKGLNHSSQLHKLERGTLAPWMKPGNEYHQYNTIMCLHAEILDFYEWMKPTPDEHHMRQLVIAKVTGVVTSLWKDAVVETFGSFQTGLYLPTSDIDLVVFGRWTNIPLHTLAKALLDEGIAESHNIRVLDRASVPIIKLVDKETDVKVDICFNQNTGLNGVKLIKDFLQRFPNLKYLVLVLKQFLLQRDLNEVYTGGISSYCLLYLIINFLQMHPRYDPREPSANVGVLLIEFFELYGCNFNFHKVGIVIRDGGAYVDKHRYFKSKNKMPGFLSIEDPMEIDNDIGKTSYGAYVVKQTFEYAYVVLRTPEPRRRLPGESILGRIVRVMDEVVDYRHFIKLKFPAPIPDRTTHRPPGNMATVSVKQNAWAKIVSTNSEGYSDGASECSEPNSSTSHRSSSCTSSLASDEDEGDRPQQISKAQPPVQSKKTNSGPLVQASTSSKQTTVQTTAINNTKRRKEAVPPKREITQVVTPHNNNNSHSQRTNSRARDLTPNLKKTLIVTNSSLTAEQNLPTLGNQSQAKHNKVGLTKRRKTQRNNALLVQSDRS